MKVIAGILIGAALVFGLSGPTPPPTLNLTPSSVSSLDSTVTHQSLAVQMGLRALDEYSKQPYAKADFLTGIGQWGWQYHDVNGVTVGDFTGIVWSCGDELCYAGLVEVNGQKHFTTGT